MSLHGIEHPHFPLRHSHLGNYFNGPQAADIVSLGLQEGAFLLLGVSLLLLPLQYALQGRKAGLLRLIYRLQEPLSSLPAPALQGSLLRRHAFVPQSYRAALLHLIG